MSFNLFSAGQRILAAALMQNFRHVNFGNDLAPVDVNGSMVNNTINLGSWMGYFFKDGLFQGNIIAQGNQNMLGGDVAFTGICGAPGVADLVFGNKLNVSPGANTVYPVVEMWSNYSYAQIFLAEVTVNILATNSGTAEVLWDKYLVTGKFAGTSLTLLNSSQLSTYDPSGRLALSFSDAAVGGNSDLKITIAYSGTTLNQYICHVKVLSGQGYTKVHA